MFTDRRNALKEIEELSPAVIRLFRINLALAIPQPWSTGADAFAPTAARLRES